MKRWAGEAKVYVIESKHKYQNNVWFSGRDLNIF